MNCFPLTLPKEFDIFYTESQTLIFDFGSVSAKNYQTKNLEHNSNICSDNIFYFPLT